MQKLTLILLVFTSVCAFIGQTQTQTPPPVNVNVLNFATHIILSRALNQLRGIRIPDENGNGPFPRTRWSLFDMTIDSTVRPSSTVTRHSTILNRFTWAVTGGAITIGGRFTTKRRIIKRRGTFTLTVSGIDFTVDASQGIDREITLNRPVQCSVGGVSVRFRGARTWLLNLFRRVIARRIHSRVQTAVCNLIQTQIQNGLSGDIGK